MRTRAFRKLANSLIPARLGRLPYAASLLFLKSKLGRLGCEVWARNSYLGESFQPFLSDLDITLFHTQAEWDQSLPKIRACLNQINSKFPWIVDVNCYHSLDLHHFSPLANRYELKRDPQLLAQLPFGNSFLSTDVERAIFLLRSLDGDLNNLVNCPELRIGKWKRHFEIAELILEGPPSVEKIIRAAVKVVGLAEKDSRTLIQFYQNQVIGRQIDLPGKSEDVIHTLWRWLPQGLSHLPGPYSKLTGLSQELMEAQIAWEIWGLYSRVPLLTYPVGPHLERLRLSYGQCVANQNPLILDGLQKLQSYAQWANDGIKSPHVF